MQQRSDDERKELRMPRARRQRARTARSLTVTAFAAAVVVAVAGIAAGCGAEPAPNPSGGAVRTAEVTAKGNRFNPATIEVANGTTVTWRFDDGAVPHDVVGAGFASEKLTTGTFTHRFAEPGTYAYRCTLHPGMVGTVMVTG
jgi:plastocyanin